MDIHDFTLIEEICCSRDIPLDGKDCDIPAERNLHHIELARQKIEAFNTLALLLGLTDHEIYYIKIELDLRKFSNGLFPETEKRFWVIPTPRGSQCTGVSPTLS